MMPRASLQITAVNNRTTDRLLMTHRRSCIFSDNDDEEDDAPQRGGSGRRLSVRLQKKKSTDGGDGEECEIVSSVWHAQLMGCTSLRHHLLHHLRRLHNHCLHHQPHHHVHLRARFSDRRDGLRSRLATTTSAFPTKRRPWTASRCAVSPSCPTARWDSLCPATCSSFFPHTVRCMSVFNLSVSLLITPPCHVYLLLRLLCLCCSAALSMEQSLRCDCELTALPRAGGESIQAPGAGAECESGGSGADREHTGALVSAP